MMRTRRNSRAAWPLAVAWAFAGALALSVANPSVAAAQSECAPYISGGPDNPAIGTLRGYQAVSLNLGAAFGLSVGVTATFYLGVYDMEDRDGRSTTYVRCDDYTEWSFQ